MGLFRFIAIWFAIAAAMAGAYDLTLSEGEGLASLSSGTEVWRRLSPGSVAAVQSGLSDVGGFDLWANALGPVLSLPAVLLLAGLAVLFHVAGRRRKRVEIFAN